MASLSIAHGSCCTSRALRPNSFGGRLRYPGPRKRRKGPRAYRDSGSGLSIGPRRSALPRGEMGGRPSRSGYRRANASDRRSPRLQVGGSAGVPGILKLGRRRCDVATCRMRAMASVMGGRQSCLAAGVFGFGGNQFLGHSDRLAMHRDGAGDVRRGEVGADGREVLYERAANGNVARVAGHEGFNQRLGLLVKGETGCRVAEVGLVGAAAYGPSGQKRRLKNTARR